MSSSTTAFEFIQWKSEHSEKINNKIFLTCEHASQEIPSAFGKWPEEDNWIVGQHWSVDIGAEILTRELSSRLKANAIVAKFSRLLCDCNRPLDSETLFRKTAEGKQIHLNQVKDKNKNTKTQKHKQTNKQTNKNKTQKNTKKQKNKKTKN